MVSRSNRLSDWKSDDVHTHIPRDGGRPSGSPAEPRPGGSVAAARARPQCGRTPDGSAGRRAPPGVRPGGGRPIGAAPPRPRHRRVDLGLGEGSVVGAEPEAEREALLVGRQRHARDRCRTGGRRAAGGPACAATRASTIARPVSVSGTTIARSRSTSGKRGTDGARSGASRPPARPVERQLGEDHALGACGAPRRRRLAGWSLAERARARRPPAAARGGRGPGGTAARASRAVAGGRQAQPAGQQLQRCPSRRRGRRGAPRGSRPAARRRPRARSRAATTRAGSSPERRIALADLEHRDVLGAVSQVDADHVEEAAEQVAPQQRVVARQRVGRRRSGRRPAAARRRPRAPRRRSRNVSRWRGETSAVVTTSVRPAPASVSRTSSRTSSGDGRKRGISVSGVTDGDELVAANPRDLLGHVRLDREVAAPGRAPRRSRASSASPDRPRAAPARGPRATIGVPAGAGSVSIPTRASSARCSSAERAVPSSRLTRAGRNATRIAARARSGAVSTTPGRDLAAGPARTSWAVRSAPIRARRGSWPFSNRLTGLGAEREPLRGAPDAHRVEDRRTR